MKKRRGGPQHAREAANRKAIEIENSDDESRAERHAFEWAELARDTGVCLLVSNRAYNEAWLAELREHHRKGFMMIVAILRAISAKDGGIITYADIVAGDHGIAHHLRENDFCVIPSNGVALEHNGEGIGHAKYSKSKNVALLWEKIGDTIFVTFDDHAPVAYHRAIRCLRELRLGRHIQRMKPRTSRWLIEKIISPWKRSRGFDPKRKYYK